MARDNRWVKGRQLDLIRSPEEVGASNRSNVRGRLETKVNTHVPQMLSLFPRLTQFLDTEARDSIQGETEPVLFGYALGDLYSNEERLRLIQGLLWQERGANESREEFLERFPDVVAETADQLVAHTDQVQVRTDVVASMSKIREELLDKIGDAVADVDGSLRIDAEGGIQATFTPSRFDIAEWIRDRSWGDERVEYLPILLECVRPEGQSDGEQSLATYRETLVKAAREQNIEIPAEWTDDAPSNSLDHHDRLLRAIDGEIGKVVRLYWHEQQIEAKRQLVRVGRETLDGLNDRQLEILDRDERDNRADDWTRYDTKQANAMIDMESPLLERQELGGRRKVYHLTDFGSVVRALSGHDTLTAGFPDVPPEVVNGALDELEIE